MAKSDEAPSVREILDLAKRAERNGKPNLANALYRVAGRMDRTFGADGFDENESAEASLAIGLKRAAGGKYGNGLAGGLDPVVPRPVIKIPVGSFFG